MTSWYVTGASGLRCRPGNDLALRALHSVYPRELPAALLQNLLEPQKCALFAIEHVHHLSAFFSNLVHVRETSGHAYRNIEQVVHGLRIAAIGEERRGRSLYRGAWDVLRGLPAHVGYEGLDDHQLRFWAGR